MTQNVIALIDGSVYAQSVCDLAAWAAQRTKATVHVLHVLGRRDGSMMPADLSGSLNLDERETLLLELAAMDEQKSKLAHRRGRLILDQAEERLEAAGMAGAVAKLRSGGLVETVREFEAGAGLIVIGKRGEAADFARLHLGSNLERVVRAAHKPVMVAARSFTAIERPVIAFDGGPSVSKAISYIAQSRLLQGLPIHLLMAAAGTPDALDQLTKASVILRNAGYQVDAKVLSGEPDEVIAREVETKGYDFLVMGAFGHSRLRNLIIGSTTTEMIRSCKIPILLFR